MKTGGYFAATRYSHRYRVETIDGTTCRLTARDAEKAALETNSMIPEWAALNPVRRIIPVEIMEVK